MSEEFKISRRKALGALGTIGVASAGAGFGTTAFFSDEETFEGNTLTAGKLDLKLDWQEHYSDWSADEAQYAGMPGSNEDPDYVLPAASDDGQDIELVFDDQDGFMAATSIEAYPDQDNDAINDYDSTLEGYTASTPSSVGDICDIGADTPEDLDPGGLRTDNDDTRLDDDTGAPLINISDVKPGDFGEVTFSLHLCDNPGYLWMFADNVSGSENGYTEPERKDPDEDGPDNESTVELLDKIQARAWYDGAGHIEGDSGNNLMDDGEPAIVEQGSLRDVLATLNDDPGQPLTAANFTNPYVGIPPSDDTDGTTGSIVTSSDFTCVTSTSVNPDCESQGYNIGAKFDQSDLPDADGSYHPISKTVTVDGTDYTIAAEVKVTAEDDGQPQKVLYRNLTVDGTTAGAGLVIVKGGPNANLCTPDDGPAAGSGSYELHSPTNPNNGKPYAISHIDFCIADIDGDDGTVPPGETPPRTCLTNSTTVYVGFEWWLPIDHGNEVQTDSVSFDLGFYTEQCRHNDGSGMSRDDQTDQST